MSPLKKFAESLIAPAWEFTLQRWGSGAGAGKAAELEEIDVIRANIDEGWIDVRLSVEVASLDSSSLYNLAMFMTRLEQGYGHPFRVDKIVSGRAVISGRMIVPSHRLEEFDRIMEDYGMP
jgi:hypothetical protein